MTTLHRSGRPPVAAPGARARDRASPAPGSIAAAVARAAAPSVRAPTDPGGCRRTGRTQNQRASADGTAGTRSAVRERRGSPATPGPAPELRPPGPQRRRTPQLHSAPSIARRSPSPGPRRSPDHRRLRSREAPRAAHRHPRRRPPSPRAADHSPGRRAPLPGWPCRNFRIVPSRGNSAPAYPYLYLNTVLESQAQSTRRVLEIARHAPAWVAAVPRPDPPPDENRGRLPHFPTQSCQPASRCTKTLASRD